MPVRHRLDELQSKLLKVDNTNNKMPKSKDTSANGLSALLESASDIDIELCSCRSQVNELKKLQQDLITSPFCGKQAITRYENLIQNITQHGVKIRESIRQLEGQADKHMKAFSDDDGFKRISKQQLSGLTTQLAAATNDFFKCQSDYADKMKDLLKRQFIAKGEGEISEKRVNEILQQDSYNVFTQNFISEVQDAEQTLRELEERHNDILALEKSVSDVNMLFKEIGLLISQQGEKLDSIEQHIDQVEVHVEAGTEQLHKANVYQAKVRRKKCCIFGILTIVLLIVIVIIVVVVLTNKSS